MARTKEQIDNLNKVLVAQGKEPIPYEHEENNGGNEEGKGQDGNAESDENGNPEVKDKLPDTPTAEINDDAVLKFLAERGIAVSSLDDLKEKPAQKDEATLKQERQNAMIAYALQNNLVNSTEYEQYLADVNAKQDLVFQNYREEALESDPELTDAEIEEEFNEKYGLSNDPDSRKFKRGQKEIALLADKIIKSRHEKVLNIESHFSAYETKTKAELERENKVKSSFSQYQKDVKAAINSVSKITVPISEGETHEFEASKETLERLEQALLNPTKAEEKILSGYTPEELIQLSRSHVILTDFNSLLEDYATKKLLKKQAGAKGIVEIGGAGKRETEARVLTEEQKMVLRMHGKEDLIAN